MPPKAPTLKPLNILCLDGGGVRGLSSLLILKLLMDQLGLESRPCEIFDLICGTSTGGLTALMLGRLRMTVQDTIKCYCELSETVFGKAPSSPSSPFRKQASAIYDASVLERCVKKIVVDHGGGEAADALLKDPRDDRCRTFVVAVTQAYADSPARLFRSYSTKRELADSCTIWEAARATTATIPLFDPATFGMPPETFVDGAFSGANNPSELARDEVSRIFPDREMGCFLSLGTGTPDVVELKGSSSKIAEACRQLIVSCEGVADKVGGSFEYEKPYFRFSVDRGLGKIALDEWSQVSNLTGITGGYLRYGKQIKATNDCVAVLAANASTIQVGATETLANEEEKEELTLQ